MTTLAVPPPLASPLPLILDGISWDTYERLVDDLETGGRHVQVTYDNGRMVLVSPGPGHEAYKTILGRLIEMFSFVAKVPIRSFGSTTWKREEFKKGMEPDECYYVQHEAKVRRRVDIDLRQDPPPDLAIEVEMSHLLEDRLAILAALGVPEVWRFDGLSLEVLALAEDGSYRPARQSAAFPTFPIGDVGRFVAMLPTAGEFEMINAWARFLSERFS